MRRLFLFGFLFVLLSTGAAFAALHFPTLTGRVVDQAGILSDATKTSLEQKLAELERDTTDQVVVVTLRSLEGTSIDDYGYQLGRSWGIGQKGKDNGVLLIVAPKERKVRIEVGYGLEGIMTDAAASNIIYSTILPKFRSGKMEEGVIEGTTAIMNTLSGTDTANSTDSNYPSNSMHDSTAGTIVAALFLAFFLIGFLRAFYFNGGTGSRGYGYLGIGAFGGGLGGGGGFGGGFSGGGGGFGGGGASGGW